MRELLSDQSDREPLQRAGGRAESALSPGVAGRERLGRRAGARADERPADECRGNEERAGQRDTRPSADDDVELLGESSQGDEDESSRHANTSTVGAAFPLTRTREVRPD